MFKKALIIAAIAEATSEGAGDWDHPCLCLFDLDRTLTGKQGDPGGHCSNRWGLNDNKVYKGILDPAYGGGRLTLSEGAMNLNKTFCGDCYVGVISKGSAGGKNSAMREKVVFYLNYWKKRSLQVDNNWNTPQDQNSSSTISVTSPLTVGVLDGAKHRVASSIRAWYNNNLAQQRAYIIDKDTWFFDDISDNIDDFKQYNYNARQISCKSRDTSENKRIGWCGMTHDEIVNDRGVSYCNPNSEDATGSKSVVV